MATILDEIVRNKRNEVADAKSRVPVEELRERAAAAEAPRDFLGALTRGPGLSLIAEIKRRSPSAGDIRPDLAPADIAISYERCGARAISVLTDQPYFGGRLEYIAEVKGAVSLPVLRKEFIVDAYQIHEARAAGADAVLLIAEVLASSEIEEFRALARSLDLGVLVEVHSEQNLRSVMDALPSAASGGWILGINNRDLSRQVTELETTERLAKLLPESTPFVSESGIADEAAIRRVAAAGACAVLVGESLLKEKDLESKVREVVRACEAAGD